MDIVRDNIRFLMGEESELAFANRCRVGQTWLHRFLAGTIKKPNLEKMGRIAGAHGLTASQLMFTDLTKPGAVASQLTGQEAEIMAAAVKLEALLRDLSPAPLPSETYSQRLYVASQVVRECGAEYILNDEKLVEGVRSLAARLRVSGG
jgi:hypothetical protein